MKLFPFVLLIIFLQTYSLSAQVTWDNTINIAASSSGNNHPRIAVDGAGDPLIIWYHASRVMFSKWDGSSFDAPRIINPVSMTVAGASWMGPDIAAKGDTVYVVYKETPEHFGHIWCMHSFDGGTSFSDPVQVDFIGDSLGRFPTVTIDADGNPLVAFMKFNSAFLEAQWVVSRSDDFGNSFFPDVLASGWSSQSSEVCDCCPGALFHHDNVVAMLYRDNKNNIRDSWAGFSMDGGSSFTQGINMDGHNWMINACPSSGPDGVILNDTLYTTFMNAASGKSLVYYNSIPLDEIEPATAKLVVTDNNNIAQQNFPRISRHGDALGIAWKQVVSGKDQLVLSFTNDISTGLPSTYDTIDLDNIMNADIAIHDGNVYVVWEDNGSGTVKFRSGTYMQTTSVNEDKYEPRISIYPNPASEKWIISGEDLNHFKQMDLLDVNGHVIFSKKVKPEKDQPLEIENGFLANGVYFVRLIADGRDLTYRVVKIGRE